MIGVDVVDVARLQAALERAPGLEKRLFLDSERAYCRARRDTSARLAGTLAAKEAVIKALRLGPLVAWARRIEITRDASGVPSARVFSVPSAQIPAASSTRVEQHRPVQVSISHDGGVAVAVALAPAAGD
jgi:holo-[acyl-carrier protein] synthase